MSTAAIPWGKLARARAEGIALPEGAALDAHGRPTTDPNEAALPLPIAGAKGSGLALMLECLSSVLVGIPLLAAGHAGFARPAWQHGLVAALDVSAFTDLETYAADTAALAASIRALPLAEGFDEILTPGERGDRERAVRLRDGVPVDAGVWAQLVALGRDLGVAPPVTGG
jgi:ureidoglycolate dehydrogenase (NAD+)